MPELTKNDFAIGMPVVCIKDHPDQNTAIKAGDTGVVAVINNGAENRSVCSGISHVAGMIWLATAHTALAGGVRLIMLRRWI